jgi:threonine dehydrogenase-like Zn-dependent dehydrogenase
MRAAVLVGPKQLEVREVPTPSPKSGEVLVRVLSASVCGSDIHAFQGDHPLVKPGSWFGHEMAGEVAGLGEGVTGLRIGQRAAVDGVLPCGKCRFCLENRGNICVDYRITGARQDGALAEFMCVPSHNVYPVPDRISMDEAALVQPLSIAYHGTRERTSVQPGETVVIMGAGPIGLCCLAHCVTVGAKAIVFDLREARLEMAREMGAWVTVDLREEDPLEVVNRYTDGFGVDKTIECVGSMQDETMPLACKVTRRGGDLTVMGSFSMPRFSLLSHEFRWKELTLRSSHSYASNTAYAPCVELVSSGAIKLAPLVTHVFPLSGAQEALARLDQGDQTIVKALIRPNE